MKLSESLEMYLEAILILKEKQSFVRAVDISAFYGYAKSSVHKGLMLLKKKQLISIDGHGLITFTLEGNSIANKIYRRHLLLTKWLVSLGVPKKNAEQDACRIEHVISDITCEILHHHYDDPE
jgi:Mn-dependent DtxR family transcriptional regulator